MAYIKNLPNLPLDERLKAALGITEPAARADFLAKLPPMFRANEISTALKLGDRIQVGQQGEVLEIAKFVDKGKRGVVFQVKDMADGKLFALKVAHAGDAEALRSIAKESIKTGRLSKHKLSHAAILTKGENFVLKEWIEGQRADAWLNEWAKKGAHLNDPGAIALTHLLQDSANSGAYVGDLNAKNLIWTGEKWVIIDSGSVREDLSLKEILARYRERMNAKWSKVSPTCAVLFSSLQPI